MGCSHSKFGDDEAVQICKDRKRFIKQAVEHRTSFASGHIAYIQSLRKVSDALREYIEGDEPHEFSLDTFVTPVKRLSSSGGFIELSPSSKTIQSKVGSKLEVNYLMASGSRSVRVEEKPPTSPETYRVETFGADSLFGMNMNMNKMNSPAHNSLGIGSPNIPPPSPQNSQWDFFWNPFSSLDYYGYGYDNRSGMDDEFRRLRRVREEEGIPDLEEDESPRFEDHLNMKATEDCNGGKMYQEDKLEDANEEFTYSGREAEKDMNCIGTQEPIEVSRGVTTGHVVTTDDAKRETHGFTVYLNRRPTCMGEVIKDLEDQFGIICSAANEVSGLLEANRAQYMSCNELSAMKMLNPVALFRSGGSSRSSSSSRLLIRSESSSDFSEESCMLSGSHQSTLDRLYAWEKKLYDEVKSGERIRIAYEKKCLALRNHDVNGDNSSAVDKTRATIRDLHTQMKVSIHSIESISERIETLRDQELLPQLLELLQGLAQMWKVMAECHQIQKRTLDEAKLLLAATMPPKKRQQTSLPEINTQRLARSALNLVAQLRNWRACFQAWITFQRSYVLSLTGWYLRCFRCDPDPEKVRLSTCPHRIYEVCIGWSRLLNGLNEKHVVDKLDFFASGMGSIFAWQFREEDSSQGRDGSRRYSGTESMELVEADKVEEEKKMMNAEKLAEIAVKVLCHGMSVAVSSLAEFAISSADEHSKLVNHPEDDTSEQHPEQK